MPGARACRGSFCVSVFTLPFIRVSVADRERGAAQKRYVRTVCETRNVFVVSMRGLIVQWTVLTDRKQ